MLLSAFRGILINVFTFGSQGVLPLREEFHEPLVRPNAGPFRPDVSQCLIPGPAILVHQVRRHHQSASTHAMKAVDECLAIIIPLVVDEIDPFAKPTNAGGGRPIADGFPSVYFAFIPVLASIQIQYSFGTTRRLAHRTTHEEPRLNTRVVLPFSWGPFNYSKDDGRGDYGDKKGDQKGETPVTHKCQYLQVQRTIQGTSPQGISYVSSCPSGDGRARRPRRHGIARDRGCQKPAKPALTSHAKIPESCGTSVWCPLPLWNGPQQLWGSTSQEPCDGALAPEGDCRLAVANCRLRSPLIGSCPFSSISRVSRLIPSGIADCQLPISDCEAPRPALGSFRVFRVFRGCALPSSLLPPLPRREALLIGAHPCL